MVVIDLGYNSFVMTKEQALSLIDIIEKAELYESKYINKEDRERLGLPAGVDQTHHVYPNEKTFNMRIINDDLYRMAKLAGKPEK